MFLLVYSYLLDLIFGDPEWFPHPVRWMGVLIRFLDNRLRCKGPFWIERVKGVIMAVTVVGVSTYLTYLFIGLAKGFNPLLGNLVGVYLGYTTLSIKDLRLKAKAVLSEIEKGSVVEARKKLSKIVSRDTQELDKDKIIIATIESLAENTSDGIIAPLFYLILGGPVLAIAYKSINTLDSMVGYRNERYRDFGWFSAKLDDVVNFIPTRISGLLIPAASFILGKGFKASFETMLKDGRKHPSPNSGIPEAAMAGALGIRLGGKWFYDGELSTRPFLGDEKRPVEPSFINDALKISFITSLLLVLIGVYFKGK